MPLTGTGSSPGRNSPRWNARRWYSAVSRLISSRRSSLVRSGMRETTMEDRRWKMEVTGPFDLPSSIFHLRSSIFDLPSREGSKEEPRKLPEDGRIFADQSLGEQQNRPA